VRRDNIDAAKRLFDSFMVAGESIEVC
jgi:hypothetical protein